MMGVFKKYDEQTLQWVPIAPGSPGPMGPTGPAGPPGDLTESELQDIVAEGTVPHAFLLMGA
jgi:hypothetical protein